MCYVCEDCANTFKVESTLLVNCEDYIADIPIEHEAIPTVKELPSDTTLTV